LSQNKVGTNLTTNKKYFCFAQITDTHGDNKVVKRAVEFLNSLEFQMIDCLIHTGDIQYYQFEPENSGLKARETIYGDEYKEITLASIKPFFTCLGNHDVYKSTSLYSLYNRFMKPMVDKGFITAGTNIDASNYATWYYKDFLNAQIRLIVLDDFDPLYDGYTKPLNTTAYSPEQINFLINTLSSAPEGYTIIVAQHFPPCKGNGYTGTITDSEWNINVNTGDSYGTAHESVFTDNVSPVLDILGAFKEKTTLTKTYTYKTTALQNHYGSVSVNVDFTETTAIMGVIIAGHDHNDLVYKFVNHDNLLTVAMVGSRVPTYSDSKTLIFREQYGKSYDAINVFCVRTDERKLYLIRVGADYRADGKAQLITSFSY